MRQLVQCWWPPALATENGLTNGRQGSTLNEMYECAISAWTSVNAESVTSFYPFYSNAFKVLRFRFRSICLLWVHYSVHCIASREADFCQSTICVMEAFVIFSAQCLLAHLCTDFWVRKAIRAQKWPWNIADLVLFACQFLSSQNSHFFRSWSLW